MDYQRQSREDRQPTGFTNNPAAGADRINLSGPVGLRWRVNKVTNSAEDQQKVIGLLAEIPKNEGGRKGSWTPNPLAGPNGNCPKFLADAIWQFQAFWKDSGLFKNIDGVVDPGGNTLRHMNHLVFGKGGGRVMPIDPKPKGAGFLQVLFSKMAPRPTNWRIEKSSTISLSFAEFGFADGTMVVSNKLNPGSAVPLLLNGAGLSLGPAPAGIEITPSSFPSMGSPPFNEIHAGPRTRSTTLPLDDLLGMCLMIGASVSTVGAGANATTLLFNIGANRSLKTLPRDLFNSMNGPSGFLLDAFNSCRGFANVAGTFAGLSIGVSVIEVYLRRAAPDIRPDPM